VFGKLLSVQKRPWILLLVVISAGSLVGGFAADRSGSSIPESPHTIPMYGLAPAQAPAQAGSLATGFSSVVQKVLPTVVNISSTKVVKAAEGSEPSPFFSDPFFRQFFGDSFQRRNMPRDRRDHSLGSGVIISPEGYILTNNHVVEGASEIKVTLSDKQEQSARLVGRDPGTDVALLKIDGKSLPALAFGDSSKVKAGDLVLAIGSPFGLSQTVTMGIVSATGRGGLDIEDYENFIQTDAAINPGNSGGALVNTRGELIGINTAILSGGGGNQGIGFAIPVDMARGVMEQLLKNGKVIRGYIGATIQQVTPGMAKAFNLKGESGALISEVKAGGPAARAGLASGDIVVAMDGKPVTDMRELRLAISMTKPGTPVHFKVFRDGVERDVTVTLGELPAEMAKGAAAEGQEGGQALQGVSVDELTPQVLRELGLPAGTKGVVVSDVSESSRAADAGLRQGDVIQQVNREPVTNVANFERLVRAGGSQPILLLVNRGGHSMFMLIEP
jgi:serine protease Do